MMVCFRPTFQSGSVVFLVFTSGASEPRAPATTDVDAGPSPTTPSTDTDDKRPTQLDRHYGWSISISQPGLPSIGFEANDPCQEASCHGTVASGRTAVLRERAEVARKAASTVTGVVIANSGHWIAEEQPADLLARLVEFLG